MHGFDEFFGNFYYLNAEEEPAFDLTDTMAQRRSDMLHKSRMLMVALGLVCASGASANAADLCVSLGGGGGTLVGKGFTLPEVNTCKPFSAFEDGGLAGAATGTGCVDRNGGTFILHYSYHNSFPFARKGSYFESGLCRFKFGGTKLPAPGSCRGTVLTSPDNHGDFNVQANLFNCSVEVPENIGP
jgi:hypothetical protein